MLQVDTSWYIYRPDMHFARYPRRDHVFYM